MWARALVRSCLYCILVRCDMRIPKGVRSHFFDCTRFGDVHEWIRVVDVVWDVLAAGKNVYVHCVAGIHRAPVAAAGILAALLGISFPEAYECVASVRYVEPWHVAGHLGPEGVRALLEAVGRVEGVQQLQLSSSIRLSVASASKLIQQGQTNVTTGEMSGSIQSRLDPLLSSLAALTDRIVKLREG